MFLLYLSLVFRYLDYSVMYCSESDIILYSHMISTVRFLFFFVLSFALCSLRYSSITLILVIMILIFVVVFLPQGASSVLEVLLVIYMCGFTPVISIPV